MQTTHNNNNYSTIFITERFEKSLKEYPDKATILNNNLEKLKERISSSEIRWIAFKIPFIAFGTAAFYLGKSLCSLKYALQGRITLAKEELLSNLQLCTHFLGLTLLGITLSATLLYRGHVIKKTTPLELNNKELPLAPRSVIPSQDEVSPQPENHYQRIAELIRKEDRRWHGLSSFARILFQDDEILQKLSNHFVLTLNEIRTCHLLVGHQDYQGNEITIADLACHALADNDLWYLFTASPNYPGYPSAEEGIWQGIQRGLPSDKNNVCVPKEFNKEVLQTIITQILAISSDDLTSKISFCSANQLLQIIRKILKERAIDFFNQKSGCQSPMALRDQTYSVMADWGHALAYFGDDYAKTISCPVFSHALDADHLMAAIYYIYCDMETDKSAQAVSFVAPKAILGPIRDFEDLEREAERPLAIWEVGKESLEKLLYRAESNELTEDANQLLCSRLRQVLRVMLKNCPQELLRIPADRKVPFHPTLAESYKKLPRRHLLSLAEEPQKTEFYFTKLAIAQHSIDRNYTDAFIARKTIKKQYFDSDYIIEVPASKILPIEELFFYRKKGYLNIYGNQPEINLEEKSLIIPPETVLSLDYLSMGDKKNFYNLAIVSVPFKKEEQGDQGLVNCYLRLIGRNRVFDLRRGNQKKILRPLGLNMGWSIEESLRAARKAYLQLHLMEKQWFHSKDYLTIEELKNLSNYVEFIGYEEDGLFKQIKSKITQEDCSMDIEIRDVIPTPTYLRSDTLLSFLPLLARENVQGGDSYGVATLYDVSPERRKPHSLRLKDSSSTSTSSYSLIPSGESSLIQMMNNQKTTVSLALLYRSLTELLGESPHRLVTEFSGYNAEELSIRRSDENIQIVVTLPPTQNAWMDDNAALTIGYQRVEKGEEKAALILELSSDGELNLIPRFLVDSGLSPRTSFGEQEKSKEESREIFERRRHDFQTSICQLFLEHIKVGTFSKKKDSNPFEILFTVCEELVLLDQSQSSAPGCVTTRSLFNPIICSQDSIFELATTPLEDEALKELKLQPGACCFKLKKEIPEGGGERQSRATSAVREIQLYQGIDNEGNLYVEACLTKQDHTRVLSDQSIDRVTTSRLRLKKKSTNQEITSIYIKDDQKIIFDGFAANFNGSDTTGSHESQKQIVKAGKLSKLSPEAIDDCKYILQALSNNLALLKSQHTMVDEIYHVDGTVFGDRELLALMHVRQGPVQLKAWHHQIRFGLNRKGAFRLIAQGLFSLSDEQRQEFLIQFSRDQNGLIE